MDKYRILLAGYLGTSVAPVSPAVATLRALSSLTTAGMLAKAGFNSLTDYVYGTQHMLHAGIMNSRTTTGLENWVKALPELIKLAGVKDIRNQLGMAAATMKDTMLAKLLRQLDPADAEYMIRTGETGYRGALENVTKLASQAGQGIFKFTMVDAFTNWNRDSLRFMAMRSIGSKANTAYKNLKELEMKLLGKHNITDFEWDGIIRKHAMATMDDHMGSFGFAKTGIDTTFYFPERIAYISDKEMRAFMKKHNVYGAAKKK